MRTAIKIWKETFHILKRHPKIIIPFALVGILNSLLLYLLYLAPQRPVSALLAPPVKVFFGEKFLHYPFHLYLLPRIFYYAHIFVIATAGILMTGLAIGMLKDAILYKKAAVFSNLLMSLKQYLALLGIWAIAFLIYVFLGKSSHFIKLSGNISTAIPYLVSILIQLIFAYAMPAVIIEKKNIFSSIKKSFSLLKKFFLPTMHLIMAPAMLYLPIMVLKQNLVYLAGRFSPEVILIVLAGGIFVSLIVDILITTSPTIVFLRADGVSYDHAG